MPLNDIAVNNDSSTYVATIADMSYLTTNVSNRTSRYRVRMAYNLGGQIVGGPFMRGAVYVDRFCMESSSSSAQPTFGPIQLVLIDPSGSVLNTANNSTGIATINRTVSGSGIYTIKVVNLSLGSVKVWTAATPHVRR